MPRVRMVERVDGTWAAFVEGHEDDAVTGPTDDAALGRLLRAQPERLGVSAVDVTPLDRALSGEPAALFPGAVDDPIGPDSEAPGPHPSDDLPPSR